MKRIKKTLFLLTIGIFLVRCSSDDKRLLLADKWYTDTKTEILNQSSKLKPDSTTIEFNKDSTFRREHLFYQGIEFSTKGYENNSNIKRLEIFFSADHNFELRREICEDGKFRFEGIFYKGNAFGPSSSYHCNGQLSCQDIRFNGQDIGTWKTWDEEGKIREEIDYKNLEKLDSLPIIDKQ